MTTSIWPKNMNYLDEQLLAVKYIAHNSPELLQIGFELVGKGISPDILFYMAGELAKYKLKSKQ